MKGMERKVEDTLTPPITPNFSRNRVKADLDDEISRLTIDNDSKESNTEHQIARTSETPFAPFSDTTAKPYLGTYRLDSNQVLGHGAWSTVHRATQTYPPVAAAKHMPGPSQPTTPPSSPEGKWRSFNAILAIKSPHRRDAQSILLHEARVLAYLHQRPAASQYIIAFHGWDAPKFSLVLTAYPQTLEQYYEGIDTSELDPTEPALGRDTWTGFVRSLVHALAFLHEANCVHGDIKPSNVLLSFESSDSIRPLLADFSSSHVVPPDGDTSQIPAVSATTTEYTSPELLAAMLPRDSRRAIASFANDVYGLGVTLLEAAVGQKPYASANRFMKLAMAKEGRVMDFVSGESRRVGKGVRGLIGGACVGKEEDRWDVEKWLQLVVEGWRD